MEYTTQLEMEREKETRLQIVKECAAFWMKPLPYHNFLHAKDVTYAVQRLARGEKLSPQELHLLETAAYLHDIIYETGAKDNEEKSALMGRGILVATGYSPKDIQKIEQLVLATKIPTTPKNKLEEILCDADVDNLGRDDFFEKCESLRQENNVQDKLVWYSRTLKFLENHNYYTQTARNLRQAGLEKNMQDLKALIGVF